MKCALCGKDVRQHKREMVQVTNEGVLEVEPNKYFKLPMHKKCATHYRVTERMLISAGIVKPKEKEEKSSVVVASSTVAKANDFYGIYRDEYLRDEEPKYNVFGERRRW